MAVINLSDSSTLELYEIGENSKFESLTIEDTMGGDFPKGVLTLKVDYDNYKFEQETLRFKYKQYDGLILQASGSIYHTEFKGFLYTIKFVLLPKEFTDKTYVRRFESFDDVLSSLWKGKQDIDTRSDIINSKELYQTNLTNYNYLTKLLKAYRKDCIYGYSIEALVIRNLTINNSIIELAVPEDAPLKIGKSKYFDKDPLVGSLGYKESVITQGSYLTTFNSDYSDLINNYYYNIRYYTDWRLAVSLQFKYLPKITIGDQVTLKSPRHKFKSPIIWKRIISISGTEIKVDIFLKSN